MKKYVVILAILLGIALHGQSSKTSLSRDSINIALSYGAQAVDLLKVYERIIQNQKAQIVQQQGLASNLDMQVEVLSGVVEKKEVKTWWAKAWAWIRGALVGAATAIIVTSI